MAAIVPVPAAYGADGESKTDELDYRKGLSYLLKESAPAPNDEKARVSEFIRKSLLSRDDGAARISRMKQSYSSAMSAVNLSREDRTSIESRAEINYSENMAKEQAYQLLGRMALQFDTVAKLRDVLEPMSRPIQIYSDGGNASAEFFGFGEGNSEERGEKVLGVGVALSSRMNLDVTLDIGHAWRLSYFDGTVMDLRYTAPKSNHIFGVRSMGGEAFSLMYGFSF
ncbi:MAG: hypothetical protein HZB29_12640 [Nitrospinae bacterium]|nr:hypothetical protein [Nitrospinota bacterium]